MTFRQDNIAAEELRANSIFKLGKGNGETLGAARTLVDGEGPILAFDAGGSSRNVTLPARAVVNDGVLLLVNNISTAGETLVIKNSAATTLLTLPSGGVALIFASVLDETPGTKAWRAVPLGGEDLALADDLTVTGDTALTGNLAVTGTSAFTGTATFTAQATFNGNVALGDNTADLIAFWGLTKTSQPTSASQGVVASTAIVAGAATIITAGYGATTTAQLQSVIDCANSAAVRAAALTTLTNQLRADLVSVGIIKGS